MTRRGPGKRGKRVGENAQIAAFQLMRLKQEEREESKGKPNQVNRAETAETVWIQCARTDFCSHKWLSVGKSHCDGWRYLR